jgi:hypothetical protein
MWWSWRFWNDEQPGAVHRPPSRANTRCAARTRLPGGSQALVACSIMASKASPSVGIRPVCRSIARLTVHKHSAKERHQVARRMEEEPGGLARHRRGCTDLPLAS